MGAGSRGEGGGEEEGGGLWAPAPFIAAAGRAGVPRFRSHGGANSSYQQAPGCLQHGGRRHHPVASDRRGGNAGERRGRRPPRPEPGARAWWRLRQRPRRAGLCGPWEEGAAAGTRALGAAARLPARGWLLRAWESGPGRETRGGAGAAGPAGAGGGLGEGRAGGRNWSPRRPGAAGPAGLCLEGHLGDARRARGRIGLLAGQPAPPRLLSGRPGFYPPPCLARGCGVRWNREVRAEKAAAVWHPSVSLQCDPFMFPERRSS